MESLVRTLKLNYSINPVVLPVSEVVDGCVDDDEDLVVTVDLNITLN